MREVVGRLLVGLGLFVAAAACTSTSDTATTSSTTASSGTSSTTASSVTSTTTTPASSSTPGSTAAAASDKASFLEKGNAICKEMNRQSEALSQEYAKGSKAPADLQKLLDANGDLIEQSVASMRALPQPQGDEAKLASMYADVEKLASYSHRMATAAGQGNNDLVQQLQTEGKAVQQTVNREFTAYGLTECGKGS